MTPEGCGSAALDLAYVAAIRESVEASLARLPFTPDALVASFHGMPERTLRLGDPYHCHCRKTARLLGISRNVVRARLIQYGEVAGFLRTPSTAATSSGSSPGIATATRSRTSS